MTKDNKYVGVDIIKFIMSICVVAEHTNPLVSVNNAFIQNLYFATIKCAVPYFFLATGYFLGRKIEYDEINKCYLTDGGGYNISTKKIDGTIYSVTNNIYAISIF